MQQPLVILTNTQADWTCHSVLGACLVSDSGPLLSPLCCL